MKLLSTKRQDNECGKKGHHQQQTVCGQAAAVSFEIPPTKKAASPWFHGGVQKQALQHVRPLQYGTESNDKTPGKYGIAEMERMTHLFLRPPPPPQKKKHI